MIKTHKNIAVILEEELRIIVAENTVSSVSISKFGFKKRISF